MEHSATILNNLWRAPSKAAELVRVGLLCALLATLAACGGSDAVITNNDLAEPASDGVAPVLESVTIKMARDRDPKPNGKAKLEQEIQIDIVASEAIMKPSVSINGVPADEVTGNVRNWRAKRMMTEFDVDGDVTFEITFQDTSGEVGAMVSATTDGSAVQYCIEGCADGDSTLAGDWLLDGDGAAGVGPSAGSTEWWASVEADRPCWYDDVHRFGEDGSFLNIMGDETFVEAWQGGADSCATPVAPHDGSTVGTYTYDEDAGTLTITGKGAHIALPKAVNGQELTTTADTPDSVVYQVLTLDGDSMTVTLETGPGVWWTFRLARVPASPLAGKWKLDGDGAAGVGPSAGSMEWWASVEADRPCWYDDIYDFGADGSFSNVHGDATWVEGWQGGADSCAAPVAPHDGSADAVFTYDEDASTLTLMGKGAYLAVPKAVNGQELSSVADTPDFVTYQVTTLDGDSMSLTVETAAGVWWSFNLKRVSTSPLKGNWKLDGDGAAGVGPSAGSTEWWASVEADRPCWYDDIMHFGADGTFVNAMGGETFVEAWQGGADAIRTWGVGDGSVLEEAHARGMTVLLCLDIAPERLGFDYDDTDAVNAQLERARSAVRRYKNHPALLGWMIGNELNLMHTNPKVWDAVNDISKMIHKEDGPHPTTTALAGLGEDTYSLIQTRAPDLDFLSTQVYGMLTVLHEHVAAIGVEMPIMVTEWGTVGHWELPQTDWGAPLELTSTEKAAHYLKGYELAIAPFPDQVLGSFVFLWGQKQERTPTWYGMFTLNGEITEPVDAAQKLWSGQWPENRAPYVDGLFLDDQAASESVLLQPGADYPILVEAGDIDSERLSIEWVVMEESQAKEIGGDREAIPATLRDLVASASSETVLRAPEAPGTYRLFVYVRDPEGKVAHANLPFKVEA